MWGGGGGVGGRGESVSFLCVTASRSNSIQHAVKEAWHPNEGTKSERENADVITFTGIDVKRGPKLKQFKTHTEAQLQKQQHLT